jgi:RNA polymerase sigma-70 factor (ECF subfamily)
MPAPPATIKSDDEWTETVAACCAGDPDSFRPIVQRYQRPVISLISRLTGCGPHVEDLAQETFLAAYHAIGRYDPRGPAKLSTWLLTIAARRALDHRKRSHRSLVPLNPDAQIGVGSTPESELMAKQRSEALGRAVAQLDDQQRTLWTLTQEEGLSHADAAALVGESISSVKVRLFRARQRLRGLLASLWSSS